MTRDLDHNPTLAKCSLHGNKGCEFWVLHTLPPEKMNSHSESDHLNFAASVGNICKKFLDFKMKGATDEMQDTSPVIIKEKYCI